MERTSAIAMLRQGLIVFSMVVLMQRVAETSEALVLRQPKNQSQVTALGPPKSAAGAVGCQWTYYPISGGQLQPEQLLYTDPDNTPISSLSLGNPFKSNATSLASLATTGATDFDADGKPDVFRTWPRPDGFLQWQYSSGGTGAWQDLAYASSGLPTSLLQFGEFDGDAKTDVFANVFDTDLSAFQWVYSPSGTESFVSLRSTTDFPYRRALGDFNGDGKTDVFTAVQQNDFYQWGYYPGGNGSLGSLINLAHAATDPQLLRFGDFNGDGETDVFAADQLGDGSTQWKYSSGGADSYTDLITTTVPYAELKFGDFDGDGKTDVLAALPQSDGGLQVTYWPGGLGAGVNLGHIPAPAPALRVGDFNGDGTSDLMALRCGMAGPLTFGPLQILADSGYNTFQHSLAGDVNGDGRADVILVSTCQNQSPFGFCGTYHLQVGAALGAPGRKYTLAVPLQLGEDSVDFSFFKAVAGDFDGDGKTDLALVRLGSSDLTLYVAHSNGNGSFTLGNAQTFGNEGWSNFNPIVGDFNGDGKADLAFATVCSFSYGSCSNGDKNSVYVAMSNGSGVFTLGARQDLGPATGWVDYTAVAGDFNGDGKTDLVFNSTCQKANIVDLTCTVGDANLVYTALSNGLGGFTLSAKQIYGSSGWSDYSSFSDVVGDVNGDGRSDLVWSSGYQSTAKTLNNLVVAGLANPDGTFQLGSSQNFGSDWTGQVTLADLNHDGKADLVWNTAPDGDMDVYTYAAATSSGDGTFTSLGPGAVYTGPGRFQMPETNAGNHLPTGLAVVSVDQDPISSALIVVDGGLPLATACIGDCSGDSSVTVDELLTMVNIALGNAQITQCDAGDASGDGQITVDEILTAVSNALNGCPG